MSLYDKYPPLSVQLDASRVQQWLDSQDATPKTPEQIAKMSWAERLDYARKFDQSAMPAWRDPRAK